LSVAQEFSSDNLAIISQRNKGASAARNEAFSLCKGDLIQWLDADDVLAPDKIALQIEALNRCGGKRTLISGPWAHFIYRPHKAKFIPTPLWADLSPVEWLWRKLDQNLHMQPASWLVSRELTEAAGPWDTRLSVDDDGEYFCRILLACDRIHFVPDGRTFYRRSDGSSLSHVGRSNKKLESQFLSMQLHIGYIRSLEDSERVRRACVKYLQRWLIYFYPHRHDLVARAQAIAKELGGQLEIPRLPWEYDWIQKLFGWEVGKRAWVSGPRLRSSLTRSWDKAMYYLENT
jgi:glycosyltransferase involved in cell wall biosynthesis